MREAYARLHPAREESVMPKPPPSPPIALSDDQLTIIMHAAQPLAPTDRAAFLVLVAARLRGVDVSGDGLVSRVCREAFREFWDAPVLDHARGTPRQLRRMGR
jgi:hypothetical protein